MRNLGISFFLCLALAACSNDKIETATADVGKVAAAVQEACTGAIATANAVQASPLAMIPQVAGVLPYVSASCGTVDAIAVMVQKAVNDPKTVAWIENLNADLKKDVADVKAVL